MSNHIENKFRVITTGYTYEIIYHLHIPDIDYSIHNYVWLDMVCDSNEMKRIFNESKLNIHQLSIEDCMNPDCREKMEKFQNYIFFCLKVMDYSDNSFEITPLYILCFESLVITYHTGNFITEDIVFYCITNLEKRHQTPIPHPGWVFHAILDRIIDNLIPKINKISDDIDACKKIHSTDFNSLLNKIDNTRNNIFWYIAHLSPKLRITKNVVNVENRKKFMKKPGTPYWVDIDDHVNQMKELLNFDNQILESIQNTFVSKVSLEIAAQSNNLTKVGGKLAAIGSIFLPLTFITGLWGMNCKVPFQFNPLDDDDIFSDSYWGFLITLGLMVLFSFISWKYIKKWYIYD